MLMHTMIMCFIMRLEIDMANLHIPQTIIYSITSQMSPLSLDATEYFRNYSGCCIKMIRM